MSNRIRAALAAEPPAPNPHEVLAARPLLEAVVALDSWGEEVYNGQLPALQQRIGAWLAENPPGQPVAIEPRGCPAPGACSCVEPAAPDHIPDATKMVSDGEREGLAQWLDELGHRYADLHSPSTPHLYRAAALLRQPTTTPETPNAD